MSRYLCLACEVLARPLYQAAAQSPHVVDIELLQRGLHNQPAQLKEHLQEQIDRAEGRGYDAVLLGYGLCGNGAAGLAARSIPLVISRAHDCISLLLGDRQRYQDQFNRFPGTYWYSQDFLERSDSSGKFACMGPVSDDELARQYEEYIVKYGRENADYLMETLGSWQAHYQRAVFIDMGTGDVENLKRQVAADARRRGWAFATLAGDLILFRQLVNGDWLDSENDRLIVIPPGSSLGLSYDEQIFCCEQP